MKKKNLGTLERALRVGLGAIVAGGAALFFFTAEALIWRLAFVALFGLGVDFVVTGLRGYCPLYNLLGWSTAPSHAQLREGH